VQLRFADARCERRNVVLVHATLSCKFFAADGLTGGQADRLREWNAEYREKLNKVLQRAYKKPSARTNPLRELESLAHFLNSDDPFDSTLRSQLLSELKPLIAWKKTSEQTVKNAASTLARRLSNLRTGWEPFFLGKKSTFAIQFPRDWYGVIAQAIQEGNFRKLKLCEACEDFFVSASSEVLLRERMFSSA
jgi:hypothetical protein